MTSQLSVGFGGGVSEGIGQHTIDLTLRNTSSTTCSIDGYPGIALLGADGAILPFEYQRGGDQMTTSAPPQPVGLTPGGVAYIRINKYRCDIGDKAAPMSVQVIAPNDTTSTKLAFAGQTDMSYCGAGDPGSVLHISPVEPTEAATNAG